MSPADHTPRETPDVSDVDRERAERIRAGDLAAYEAFYVAHSSAVYAFVVSLVRDTGVAEDLVQEAFVRLWERRGGVNPGQSLRTYLFTIAHHQALDHLRREATARRVIADPAVARPAVRETTDPAEAAELGAAVDRAIRSLPDRMRAVFLLQWQQGLSYAEIARVLGVTPKTVENQLGRAVKHLRDALAPYRR